MINKFLNIFKQPTQTQEGLPRTVSYIETERMKKFFIENKDYVKCIPIKRNGFFNSGPIVDHVIKRLEDVEGYHAIAVLPDPEYLAVLDIDSCGENTKDLRSSILDNLSELMVIYHHFTDLSTEEVIKNKRFKVLLKPNDELKSISHLLSSLASKHIELAWQGGKPFSVVGRHRSERTEYRMLGGVRSLNKLNFCPDNILKSLEKLGNDALGLPSTDCLNSHLLWRDVSREHFENSISEALDCKNSIRKEEENIVKITSHCPNRNSHTTVSHPTNFTATYYYKTRSVQFSCFHKSCFHTNILLGNRLFKNHTPPKDDLYLLTKNKELQPIFKSASYGGVCWGNIDKDTFHLFLQQLPSYGKEFIIKNPDSLRLVYSCPNSHLHTLPNESIDFSVTYYHKTKEVWYGCRHNKVCFNSNLKLGLEFFTWKKPS